MDPKKVEAIRAAMDDAMLALNMEYAQLLQRLGCKHITIYR